MVTIRDVAQRLNLSITTVSRALDGYADVAETTRLRVIETAHEMGYAPSRAARQLRRQKADAVGFIIPSQKPRFSDPAFLDLISGLGDEAASHNFDLLISTSEPGSEAEKELYQRWVQTRRVDGLILTRMRLDDWRSDYLSSISFPFAATDRTPPSAQYPFVAMDGRSGIKAAVEHLISRGHRAIAFVGADPKLVLQADRFEGYRETLAAHGIALDKKYIVEGDLTRAGGYQAAQSLLDLPQPPTAVVAVNDLTALGAIRAAHERGLVVGRDLAITGFDDIADAETGEPPLTTLDVPVYEIGRKLVRMLLAEISGANGSPLQVILTPELIVRETSGG